MIERANAFNTGIASEYLVLHKLYRLGLEAHLSQGNKKSIDIRVVLNDQKTLSIDVKSVRGYSSLIVNNVIARDNHFIVFVVYNNKFDEVGVIPEIFIVPSQDVVTLLTDFSGQKRIMKGKILDYKDKWEILRG
ncbi:hypothetical protein [Algoriphagus yeomjeoni]|uniref:PD(D/E)XK endonuclease domain-containing protein n=1 Tax=Algoriphagus yeomjeoni TaxID=291403 RepID=A0A327P5B5_9BACT|nr:hypothetical protein [Algoriphagus yeomjeoni]RAI86741.1 hypothetical protein LV83_03298 [Algoriphagus yeomjeoni]